LWKIYAALHTETPRPAEILQRDLLRARATREVPGRSNVAVEKGLYPNLTHEDGTCEYWHRFVYRQENGDIPEGFVIHHKNEMKHDNGPDNLGALPANEHTPNEHWHWRTREPDRERYVPVGETDPDIPF
jgi:hypothetical protein